jgi:hypothetical protein
MVEFSSGVTFTNILGLRVPLGFEQVVPHAWAMLFYNIIFIALLMFVAGYGSRYNARYTLMSIIALAGIMWWFGWASFYNSVTDTVDWMRPLNMIILSSMLGGALYLKDANKEAFGSAGGAGSTLMNVLYYFILLQTAIGLVNMTGVWDNNSAATPTEYQYNNANVEAQVTQQNNIGGFLGGVISDTQAMANLAVQSGQMLLKIINGIAGYTGVITNAFPWVTQSAPAMAFVNALGIIIILLDMWFVILLFTRPPAIDNLGPG